MKQHINKKQLQELEKKQLYYLAEKWAYVPLRDIETSDNILNGLIEYTYKDIYENITIGKMIEILYKYDCNVAIENTGKQWHVTVATHIHAQAEELIDALWEAIKKIIQNK